MPRRVTEGPVGPLELELLKPRIPRPPASTPPPPPATPEDRVPPPYYTEQRLRLHAEGVPLHAVASALSKALGVAVVVEPPIAAARVTVFLPDTSVGRALESIRAQAHVEARLTNDLIDLMSVESWEDLRRLMEEMRCKREPLKVRMLDMTGSRLSAQQLAALYCRDLATPFGSASAVGETLLLRDLLEGLERAENCKQRIEHPEAPLPQRSTEGSQDEDAGSEPR